MPSEILLGFQSSSHASAWFSTGGTSPLHVYNLHYMLSRERYLRSIGTEPTYSLEQYIGIMEKFCKKMVYMHGIGVYAVDIKEDNIILLEKEGGSFDPVFIDVGIAHRGKTEPELVPRFTPLDLRHAMVQFSQFPPEYLLYKHVTEYHDVYSIGSVLYTLMTIFRPGDGMLYELMKKCKTYDWHKRPSMLEVADCLEIIKDEMSGEGH